MGLKIALVTSWNCRCGIATYSHDLANALAEEDIEVYVVRLPRFGKRNEDIYRDVVERIPIDKVDLIHVEHEYGLYQGCDIAFFNYLKQLGKPIITTMHGVGYSWEIDEYIAQASTKCIVHNEFCKTKFDYPNVVIIPHGAKPVASVPKDQAKKFVGVNPHIPLVGYLGFISPWKGIETMVEAMTKVENAGLLIAGGWHVEKETEYLYKVKDASLKALPNRVKWMGYVPDEQLATVYSSLDVLVYPSKWATESGALITALSHGKAVIASAVPPFIEKEKLGALVTFKDVADLTDKIRLLLSDNDARLKLEDGAHRYSEATAWPEVAKTHVKLYGEVLSDKAFIDKPVNPT